MNTKAGYVALIGLPNSGKSTLLNSMLGQKLSITANKPQTTRKSILGILSEEEYQIIFQDTPGILKPKYLLQEKMMEFLLQSVQDADLLLVIADLEEDPLLAKLFNNEFVKDVLHKSKKEKILVLNKVDKSDELKAKYLGELASKMNLFKHIIPISALMNFNIDTLKNIIVEMLPEHPKYYPEDIVSDENERFFISEIIREKVLEQYKEEVPYSTEVQIADYTEHPGQKDLINAEIIVEKESQKKIIIGKNGDAIKTLGINSRAAIEEFLDKGVFLDLRVKVREKWRSNENMLKSFGYNKDSNS